MSETGRVAIITGGSQGIGAALVAGYLERGWAVVAVSKPGRRLGNVRLCSTGITTRITTGCCSARCRSAVGGCWMSAAVPERSQPSLPSEVSRSMPSIALQR